ncbi:MAG: hypothetical protein V5A79_07980 [Candidatus Bipolaricaulota bacterium]
MKRITLMTISVGLVFLAVTFAPGIFAGQRALDFSGYEWRVRHSSNRLTLPGPNFWAGTKENVWVDEKEDLHLKLISREDEWYSSEVILTPKLGYGEYVFYVSVPEVLDKNVVLGMFNYHDDEHEIAIELARWGNEEAKNAQYTLQPVEEPVEISKRSHSFDYPDSLVPQTHKFIWEKDRVLFRSYRGHQREPSGGDSILQKWTYTGEDVPNHMSYGEANDHMNIHINLWLQKGVPPSNREEVEVVINEFEFFPL